jgi:pimeloyl-ACP methyl ester carboxylesterase
MKTSAAIVVQTLQRAACTLLVAGMLAACGGGGDEKLATSASAELQRALSHEGEVGLPQALTVIALEKISEVRVGRTAFDYTFRVSIRNDGQARADIVAQLTAVGAGTTIVDGVVQAGPIDAGATAVAADTITLRHNRAVPFNLAALRWGIHSVRAVTIGGIVTDDPVIGATVVITSLLDGSVLAIVTTDGTGAYVTPPIAPSALAGGYMLTATGGTSGGAPFVGTMRAVYSSSADYERSHVTVLTTVITHGAQQIVSDPRQLVSAVGTVGTNAVASGLIPADYLEVEVATRFAISVESEITRMGLDPYTGRLGSQLVYSSGVTGSTTFCETSTDGAIKTCSADVGEGGGRVYDQTGDGIGNLIVNVPSTYRGCTYRTNAEISDAGHRVKVWHTPNTSASCTASGFPSDATVQLPPVAEESTAPDECAAAPHSSMPLCVTRYPNSTIRPATFVTHDWKTHRVSQSQHQTTSSSQVTIARRYGANLKRNFSSDVSSGNPRPVAVVLVHGYTTFETFGGDDDTWGNLPALIDALPGPPGSDISGFQTYNFQWRTDASFREVAKDLAAAIELASSQTGGRPVHIVAHSFGGLLARTTLQGLYTGHVAGRFDGKVASLTTVGTPHSGIHETGTTVSGVQLPAGWDALGLPGGVCTQISCFEAGLSSAWIADWASDAYESRNEPSGQLIAQLNSGLSALNNVPAGLRFQVLIGQRESSSVFLDSDGLITYDGQRLIPNGGGSRPSLLVESAVGTAIVTERVLGLGVASNGRPGTTRVPGDGSTYFTSTANFGYVHNAAVGAFLPVHGREVNVPLDCGSAGPCEHDTWLNVKDLLLSLHGGSPSPNFPNTRGVRAFRPAGPPFRINTAIPNSQYGVTLAVLTGGGFVMAWDDSSQGGGLWNVKAQVYSAAGMPIGSELLVNATLSGDDHGPVVGALADGGFVIVWQNYFPVNRILFQRFSGNGTKIGQEVTLCQTQTGCTPGGFGSVAMLASGGFALGWEAANGANATFFDSNGFVIGVERTFIAETGNRASRPKITPDSGNSYIVGWVENDGLASSRGHSLLKISVVGADGAPTGTPISIYPTTRSADRYITDFRVDKLSNGRFLVVRGENTTTNTRSSTDKVLAQTFFNNGTPASPPVEIVTSSGNTFILSNWSVAPLINGDFALAWDQSYLSLQSSVVKGRVISTNGAFIGAEVNISDGPLSSFLPEVVSFADGTFAVTFTAGANDQQIRRFTSGGSALGTQTYLGSYGRSNIGQTLDYPSIYKLSGDRLIFIEGRLDEVLPPGTDWQDLWGRIYTID